MTTVSEALNGAFEALFYGSGSWLGLLLFLSIITGLLLRWKNMGALILPVTIFLGIEYLDKNLGWHAVIMFLSSVFTLLYMITKGRR